MNYLAIVLEQIGIFVVYMLAGIITVKAGVFDRQKLGTLSTFITKVLLPLLIFTNTIKGTTRQEFISSSVILAIAAVLYLLLYLLAALLAKVLRLQGDRAKVYRACTMFGNCGFMGIPIITALYPELGGLYIAMYTVIDQLVLWTVGIDLMATGENKAALPMAKRLKKMVNPATVAVLLGVFFVLTGLRLPAIVTTALSQIGAAASPLAMLYLGGVFCYISIREYLKRPEIYAMVAAKMFLLPLAVYGILRCIPLVEQDIAVTISILCALPTMSSVAMIAESQRSDSDYAAGMIFVTTLVSIATLPLVCFLL